MKQSAEFYDHSGLKLRSKRGKQEAVLTAASGCRRHMLAWPEANLALTPTM